MRTLRSGISHVQQQLPRELALYIQVPLLGIWGRIVGRGRLVAVSLHIDEPLVSAERRRDSRARKRIEQSSLRGNSVGFSRQPRRSKRVNKQVVGRIIPPHVHW